MNRSLCLLVFLICGAISTIVHAQQERELVHDLSRSWLVHDGSNYRAFSRLDNGRVQGIYFWLNLTSYKKEYFVIESGSPFSFFMNGRLVQSNVSKLSFRLDSLKDVTVSPNHFIAIRQDRIHSSNLKTHILSSVKATAARNLLVKVGRPATYFRDFVVVSLLMLLVIVTVLTRLNSRLATDYFSVIKIFSQRESDDSQPFKLSSGANILFYIFCSLIIGLLLLMVFHFLPGSFRVAWPFKATTFWLAMWKWIQLSSIILGTILLKIVVVFILSRLFGLRDISGVHIINWIRLLLLTFGTLVLVVAGLLISRNDSENTYITMLSIVSAILVIWIIILIPKVMRRSEFSMFHIFSYICATEIIPLLFTIKLLYN